MFRFFGKAPSPQSDYTAGRAVSVWVGDFLNEDELDAYLSDETGFRRDFGFVVDDRSGPEVSVEPERVSIRVLLTGFSLYEQFIEQAVTESKKKKIEAASAALVFHHLAYPETAIRRERNMRYLGCFSVEGFK